MLDIQHPASAICHPASTDRGFEKDLLGGKSCLPPLGAAIAAINSRIGLNFRPR
jgi:hypothetical protein